MKPAKPPAQEPDGLFKTPLERFIDMQHPLVVLADRIDWDALDAGLVVLALQVDRQCRRDSCWGC